MKLFKVAFAISALTMAAVSANAAIIPLSATGETCSVTDVQANPSGLDASDCAGSFDGNDSGPPARIADIIETLSSYFGGDIAEWSLLGKSDDANNGPFTNNPDTVGIGTLFLDAPIDGPIALTLKTGQYFSAYFFDSSFDAITSFDFNTIGVDLDGAGAGRDLSHASLWFLDDESRDIEEIPEPSTYALMGAGLLGIGILRRRVAR